MAGLYHNVLVVDDHKMVCEAISALVEKSGLANKVFSSVTAQHALEIIKKKRIHAALIDARMPGISGIALASIILKEHAPIKVIGMTSFDEDDTVAEMLQIGMNGILLKRNTDGKEIRLCLQEVLSGRNYFTPDIQTKLSRNGYDLRKIAVRFTKRETEIIKLLTQGLSSKQVAETLQLKDNTVDEYRKLMLSKTGAKNTAELITFTLRNGLL